MKTETRVFMSPLYRVLEDTRGVSPADAMLDLCSMVIGLPKVEGTETQTIKTLSTLSRITLGDRKSGTMRLFTVRKLERGRSWHSLVVAGSQTGEKLIFPHPTFSGQLTMKRQGEPSKGTSGQTAWDLLFSVQVSINRTIQAQTLIMDRKTLHVRRGDPYSLLLSKDAAGQVGERLLVPATNILDRSEARQRYAATKTAEKHLQEFVLELSGRCAFEIGEAKEFVPTVTLGTLEFCWDFYDEQPVIAVEIIKAKVMRIAKILRAKYAPSATVTERHEIDSPSVIVELIDGLAVRFYAKSVQTVRFEVVYGPVRIKSFKPHPGILSLNEAVETVRLLRHDAATHMNVVLSLMRQESEGCDNDATPDELIRAVTAAFPNVFEAKNILSCLALYRHVRTYPHDPRLPGLRKLKKWFVLENEPASPGARNYVVTPKFMDARRQLVFNKAMPRSFWVRPRPRHLRSEEN